MSTRKIIFLIIVSIIGLAGIIGIVLLGQTGEKKVEIPKSITVWITDGSTESYSGIIEGFRSFAPEYKNMQINIEKKTSDPIRYRTLLLSTLTDGTGPDIFMLGSGEDRVLEGKRTPIPDGILPISTLEKEYEDIFLSLMSDSGASDNQQSGRYILGVPLGFETLGIFYNKALLREIPKTWDEIEKLYTVNLGDNKYPTNLGLGPRYTPNASDIIAATISKEGSTYKDFGENSDALSSYMNYRSLSIAKESSDETGLNPSGGTVISLSETLENDKKTSYDAFMQGDVAMVIGYPSIVNELEKSTKRSGIDSVESLILTEQIPQESLSGQKQNRARFLYLSISKLSENPIGSAKFLEYLTTDDGIRHIQDAYPYLIPPKPSLYDSWKGKRLSKILYRTTLDAFIPEVGEHLSIFDYGLKAEFDIFHSEYIDGKENIDISNLGSRISTYIDCSIGLYTGNAGSADCEKKD